MAPASLALAYGLHGVYEPQVKTYPSYEVIRHGQLLFPSAWHPPPQKLYYGPKWLPAYSNKYDVAVPYELPIEFRTSCMMFKHDSYYYITTDISCYD